MAYEDDDRKEFKEYSTFMRLFSTRVIQSVVQARMGKMQPHLCSPNPDHPDVFNLIIDEIGEIAAYLKSTIGKKCPPSIYALTTEFILYTQDGETLPLEAWVVRLGNENPSQLFGTDWSTSSFRNTFYQQLSTLLRSIIIASRFTPTYRHYVFNDTFVITYQVFEGEPDFSQFGEERKQKRLGQIPSPFGTLFVELHYRTKMEIQPQTFVEQPSAVETSVEQLKSNKPLAVTVPEEGSETVSISPISAENFNLFSTSPISQDLPFANISTDIKLGRSVSFATEIGENRPRSSADNTKSANEQNQSGSPRASNSFPQHSLSNNKIRMRNNSFPFASLLLDSHNSSNSALPKVPEHGNIDKNASSDSLSIKRSSIQELMRRDSLGMEGICDEAKPDSSNDLQTSKIVFACGSVGDRSNEELKRVGDGGDDEERCKNREENEGDEEEEEPCSDDSYVKVIAFAEDQNVDELGTDLSEFVKEVKLAPDALRSFASEPVSELSKQLDEFRAKESSFSNFITGLRERGDEETRLDEKMTNNR